MRILAVVLLAIAGSSVLGVLAGLAIRQVPHRLNDIILGFAAGIMLAASVLGLLAPAMDSAGFGESVLVAGGAFGGAAICSLLDRLVPHLHRLAGLDLEEHRTNGSIGKVLLFVAAIALHKIPEGLATGVSFGTGEVKDVLTVAGAMTLQNVPESLVIVAPLFAIGVRTPRVVALSFAIALISVVSVLGGCFLVSFFSRTVPLLLGCAGGAMLYVVSDEMIPETHAHGHEKPATFALIAGLLTVLVFQRVLLLLG
jgi:ZIP family zinc transporter